MTPSERLTDAGYDGVMIFRDFDYDTALIGVTHDDRAVYDYDKMVEWLVETQHFTTDEAVEWIEYNTIRALPYFGDKAPVILYRLEGSQNEA